MQRNDPSGEWEVIASRHIVQDRWLSLRADTCTNPTGTVHDPYYVLEYPDWVNAVAITDESQVLMMRQYRHGLGQTILELPSGTVEPEDADPLAAIRRELIEETGYHFETIVETGVVSPNPANHANYTHCFLATGVASIEAPRPDPGEPFETVSVPLDQLRSLALDSKIPQSLHVCSVFFALDRLGKL